MIRRAGTGMRDQKNEERKKGNQDIIRMQKSREEKLFLCTSVFIITFAFLATQGIWPYIILILQINVLMNNHSLSFLRAGSKTQISFCQSGHVLLYGIQQNFVQEDLLSEIFRGSQAQLSLFRLCSTGSFTLYGQFVYFQFLRKIIYVYIPYIINTKSLIHLLFPQELPDLSGMS